MAVPKRERRRAVRLTAEGWAQLQSALMARWEELGKEHRITLHAQAELLNVSVVTLRKVRNGLGVDRVTLLHAFEKAGAEWFDHYLQPEVGDTIAVLEDQPKRPGRPRLGILLVTVTAVTVSVLALAFVRQQIAAKDLWFKQYCVHQVAGEQAYHRADLRQAEIELARALTIAKRQNHATCMATTLRMQGEVAAALGDLSIAVAHYKDALTIRELLQQRLAVASILEVLADAESRIGRLEDAKQHYVAGISGFAAENKPGGVAACKRGLGGVAAQQGKIHVARRWYAEALICLNDQPNPDMAHDLKARLAMLQCDEHDYETAEKELLACLLYWQKRNHPRWIATTQYQLAVVYRQRGLMKKSQELLKVSNKGFLMLGDRANAAKCSQLLVDASHARDPGSQALR